MADAYFIVTLSTAEAGSGPNYDVLYSTDCVSYSPATPSTVSLEYVGAQAYITIPDNTQCVKLTNINSNCTNSVTSSVSVTTTTTTTAAPTTTTTTAGVTTTTLAPTTTTTAAASAILDWSYSELNGANGEMILYVNGSPIETHISTAAGTETVYVGDTISVELQIFTTCGAPNTYANVYTLGNIINDAACANGTPVSLTTGTYTVVSGDVGSTLVLDTYAQCDSGCV
jgi:hypothetical protein